MNNRISFTNTRSYNQSFTDGFVEDLRSLLESGKYILGDEVKQFETRSAAYIGTKHCVTVSSGTTALELAFRSLNLNPNDEIIVPANAYIACILGAMTSGARIVPIDCRDDATMDINLVESAINKNTRAVLVVHLYGDSCDMDQLVSICDKHSLLLVEDCAQSFGSMFNGKKLGSFGTLSCHSFYPTKNLGSIGDAGAIYTNNDKLADWCRMARNLGSREKYKTEIIGTNARMDTLQAAFLLRKLEDVDSFISKKRSVASRFITELDSIHIRSSNPSVYHTYHLFVLRVNNRDEFCKMMTSRGIETIIHYPIPYYKNEPFKHLGLSFPITESLADSIVSIPVHVDMKDEDINYVIQCVQSHLI